MKKLILFCLFTSGCTIAVYSQGDIYRTSKGQISFRSDAPLEIITASSTEFKGIIDPAALTFGFTVPVATFRGFNNGLQQQHFYENYMETSKYPDATFTGKIIEHIDLTVPGTYNVRAKGQLDIHGHPQERIIKVTLVSDGNQIHAKTSFVVPLVDHQIEIPKIVNQKIAQEIKVDVQASLALTGRS